MSDSFVLDTSAIFTFTGNEPGAERVRELLIDGIAGRVQLFGSFVTLTEVEYITLQKEGPQAARQRLADLVAMPIHWLHSDAMLCSEAAKLKSTYRISFADAFVAATANHFNAILIHRDQEFIPLSNNLQQSMLPPK